MRNVILGKRNKTKHEITTNEKYDFVEKRTRNGIKTYITDHKINDEYK